MPVPKSTVENSPRKLLRDVVLEKMLAAIQDGTLQAGERLNDDELVAWLGVSRTPIREAIAKLVDYGLVEMEANRYTRVATPTAEQFDEALQVFTGIAELATRWSLPKLDDAGVAELVEILERVRMHAEAEDKAMNADVRQFVEAAIRYSDNSLLETLSHAIIPRLQFIALAESRFTFWDGRFSIDPLIAAVRSRDGDAGGAVIRALGVTLTDLLQRLRSGN
ncbi:DNA-binding GntR family transcriptional regulator [Curtobacterium luteum]|uniref:DNA-binding GntR family transcriptional regulator n=1 Tax=Curtobacterium luteum TaxID=33881 RepID=A0A8H9GBW9_9MICO|nr:MULTISPECIES: GntR family transcriptional regulator [Curtobacterium]MBM7803490.1 DNA-binding GntR family transcriptional regulator [Curtobacterium luteum]NUU50233.1 GntR family transcriptional regulator [Curtobacterium luteum]GGL00133.1 putative transcriptional regulator, GntR family protein [Curtobacterium luteum]